MVSEDRQKKTTSETPYCIEPTHLEAPSSEILDVIAELSAEGAVLGRALHPRTASNLANLVRAMNTYYSNLIEGHNTRPLDIERALAGNLEADEASRNLQLEAAAHIRVQAQVDELAATARLPEPATRDVVRWLHREFYRDAPPAMLRVRGANREIAMEPGEWRATAEHDVAVGIHIPPSSVRVDDFMRYFEERYRLATLGKASRIIAIAAAHHRFNYIHPFPDGNGRVSRLMSHAMAYSAGIGAHGLWSISRGLARGLTSRSDYLTHMVLADTPRQGDLDGRGNLSQRALNDFVLWFLKVCLDQVRFMSNLFDLDTIRMRLQRYVERSETLRREAVHLLHEALTRGEIERGEAVRLTGLGERTARSVLASVEREGLLASDTPKGPVSLRFPVHALELLFPRLYPET